MSVRAAPASIRLLALWVSQPPDLERAERPRHSSVNEFHPTGRRLVPYGSARSRQPPARLGRRWGGGRGYGTLLLAAAIPLGPAGSISILLTLPIIGRAGAVANGQLIPVGATGVDAVLVVRWTLYLLALVVALAGVVAIATGLLAGHPIRLRGALGLVGRRLPRLLLLAGAICPIPLAVVILTYGWWLIPPWTRLLALLLLVPLWALVGLPVALFEQQRISSWVGRLTVGPGALPVAALVASLAVLTLLAGAAAIGPLLLLNEVALVTLLAVVPFAGSVISAVYLDRRHGERAGSDLAAARR